MSVPTQAAACHIAGTLRAAVDGSMSIQVHSDGLLDITAIGETDAAVRHTVELIADVIAPDHAPAVERHAGRPRTYVVRGSYLGGRVRASATLFERTP